MLWLWPGPSLGHSPSYAQSSNSSSDVMTVLTIPRGLAITFRIKSSLLGTTLNVLPELALLTSTFICPLSLLPSLSSHSKCPVYLTPPYRVVKSSCGAGGKDKHFKEKEQQVRSPGALAWVIQGSFPMEDPWLTTSPVASHSPPLG